MSNKVTYELLSKPGFQDAFRKVGKAELPNRIASKIHYLVKSVNQGLRAMSEAYKTEIEGKYARRDEKGEIIRTAHDPKDFEVNDALKSEMDAAREELMKTEFVIENRDALTQHDLQEARLSGFDLAELGPFYQETDHQAGHLRQAK